MKRVAIHVLQMFFVLSLVQIAHADYATFPVVTAPGNQQWPAISGQTVVWEDSSGILGKNLHTGYEFTVVEGQKGLQAQDVIDI